MSRSATRRSGLESYRDILLSIKNTDGKITRIMNWTGLNYKALTGILEGMCARRLINLVKVEESKDRRSGYHFEIAEKGEHVGKLLVELLDYVEAEEDPDPRTQPPVVLLRLAMELRGLAFERPKEIKALPIPGDSEVEAAEETAEIIHVHRGWYDCPRCGHSVPTFKGLKTHVTTKHRGEREELLAEVEKRYHP